MSQKPTYIIYFKETCSKCRTLKRHMEEKQANCLWIAYMQQPPDEDTLTKLVEKSGLDVMEFVRRTEPLYKSKYAGKKNTQKQWIKILSKHPELLQRPIVQKEEKVWIARDENTVEELLKS